MAMATGETPVKISYPKQALPLAVKLTSPAKSPSDRTVTTTTWFSEACTDDNANAFLSPNDILWQDGIKAQFEGLLADYPNPATSFFVWQFADSWVDLGSRFDFAGLLCDDPDPNDSQLPATWDWVQPGKQIRLFDANLTKEGEPDNLVAIDRLSSLCSTLDTCRYILVDAGWYGNET